METEKCPLERCDGTGIITFEDNTYVECECRKAMHLQNYIGKALIPIAYQNKTFSDFDPEHNGQKEIMEQLKAYVAGWEDFQAKGTGVSLISKETRTGKSHLACAVAHAMITRYQKSIEEDLVLFVNVTNWVDRWRAFYARFNADSDPDMVNYDEKQKEIDALCSLDSRMNNCGLLILDDIGEVPGTEFVSSKLYSVVEYRTANNKPILITSNHEWKEIKKKYGDDGVRITDRLEEKSTGQTYYFDAPLKKRKVKMKKQIEKSK